MKDNNFDFIKDKFDSSGVNAPGEIDGQFVLDHLENRSKAKRKRRSVFRRLPRLR